MNKAYRPGQLRQIENRLIRSTPDPATKYDPSHLDIQKDAHDGWLSPEDARKVYVFRYTDNFQEQNGYQRPLDGTKVRELRQKLQECKQKGVRANIPAIMIAWNRQTNRWECYDGQHRLEAHLLENVPIKVQVTLVDTTEELAELFLDTNKHQKKVSRVDQIRSSNSDVNEFLKQLIAQFPVSWNQSQSLMLGVAGKFKVDGSFTTEEKASAITILQNWTSDHRFKFFEKTPKFERKNGVPVKSAVEGVYSAISMLEVLGKISRQQNLQHDQEWLAECILLIRNHPEWKKKVCQAHILNLGAMTSSYGRKQLQQHIESRMLSLSLLAKRK